MKPGRKVAVNSAWIEVSVSSPQKIGTIEGGIMVPRPPDAQMVPMAGFWL